MLLSVVSVGCSRTIILHPITDKDFAFIKKGEVSKIDGYLLSEYYLNEVLQAKIDSK